jgi:hypothetical protein
MHETPPDVYDRPTPRQLMDVRLAQVLPPDARRTLRRLVMIDPDVPIGGSKARTAALDTADQQLKRTYPEYFR